jgi:hypothetical protein
MSSFDEEDVAGDARVARAHQVVDVEELDRVDRVLLVWVGCKRAWFRGGRGPAARRR